MSDNNGEALAQWGDDTRDVLAGVSRPSLDAALDALEMMVEQYLREWKPGHYEHMFMSAGEAASEVLAALRPDRWVSHPAGVARRNLTEDAP